MLGAIAGDIIGSIYEGANIKPADFPLLRKESHFTDDTVLTVATADCILNTRDFRETYQEYFHKYPNAGYGENFLCWALSRDTEPYNSWGNGSAMRVSPIGFFYDTLDEVLYKAKESAEVTHNHPEGIKGAQATAAAIFIARTEKNKEEMKNYIENKFRYNLSESIDSIRTWYKFDVSCQGSVPQAIVSFLESNDYEDAIRKAISIGGDSDTIACIAGGIAQAYYDEIPSEIINNVLGILPAEFISIIDRFNSQYGILK